jgi:hypothetical protein
MDSTYDFKYHHIAMPCVTQRQIEAFSSYTWTLVHADYEMGTYLPTLGMHIIVGEVLGYGYSAPVEFEVIPEPSTFLLLVIGFIAVRVRHCKITL